MPSKVEYYLWGADFLVGGIGWLFGGTYAAIGSFLVCGILILVGMRCSDDKQGQTNPSILMDSGSPYPRTSRVKTWHKYGLVAFIVFTAIFGFCVYRRYYPARGPSSGPLTPRDPHLTARKFAVQLPSKNARGRFEVLVSYRNDGPLTATGTRVNDKVGFYDSPISKELEQDYMRGLRDSMENASSPILGNEIPVGGEGVIGMELNDFYDDDVVRNKLRFYPYLYFFIIIKTRDADTPRGLYGTTEYCGYFVNPLVDASRVGECHGTNISYMDTLAGK